MASRVVPARSETLTPSSPRIRLTSEDLPTFRRPSSPRGRAPLGAARAPGGLGPHPLARPPEAVAERGLPAVGTPDTCPLWPRPRVSGPRSGAPPPLPCAETDEIRHLGAWRAVE